MTTLYSSHFKSFLIKSRGESNYKILCEQGWYQKFISAEEEAKDQVNWDIVVYSDYAEEIERLKYSRKGFCLTSEIWNVYKAFQSHFFKKRFKKFESWETKKIFPLTFYIRRAYKDFFEIVVLNAYSGGLFHKWSTDFWLGKWIHHTSREKRSNHNHQQLKFNDIQFGIRCLITGFILSSILFVFEILVNKF